MRMGLVLVRHCQELQFVRRRYRRNNHLCNRFVDLGSGSNTMDVRGLFGLPGPFGQFNAGQYVRVYSGIPVYASQCLCRGFVFVRRRRARAVRDGYVRIIE